MSWKEFAAGAPELAAFAHERLRDTGILILATNRADGWPRISLGTPQTHHDAPVGDLKLYGRAAEVHDRARKTALEDAQEAAINWRPTEPYHAFTVDIERAGFISFGKDRRMMRWSSASGLEVLRHPDAGQDPT